MDRKGWLKKRKDRDDDASRLFKRTRRWTNLVNRYGAQAAENLLPIYQQLTGNAEARSNVAWEPYQIGKPYTPALIDLGTDTILIGSCHGNLSRVVVYDSDRHVAYPFQDRSLWPWTVSSTTTPTLTKNVWQVIVTWLPVACVLKLAQLNSKFLAFVREDTTWILHRDTMMSRFPELTSLFKTQGAMDVFRKLRCIPQFAKDRLNVPTAQTYMKRARRTDTNIWAAVLHANVPWRGLYHVKEHHVVDKSFHFTFVPAIDTKRIALHFVRASNRSKYDKLCWHNHKNKTPKMYSTIKHVVNAWNALLYWVSPRLTDEEFFKAYSTFGIWKSAKRFVDQDRQKESA